MPLRYCTSFWKVPNQNAEEVRVKLQRYTAVPKWVKSLIFRACYWDLVKELPFLFYMLSGTKWTFKNLLRFSLGKNGF